MNFEDRVIGKLDKIETLQTEHTIQLALNTSILSEHHRRSTNLERRMEPIEDHVKFVTKLIKMLVILIPILGTVVTIVTLLIK